MDDLSKRLRAVRADAVPRRDLWPGVAARIRTRGVVQWQHAAAAILLFAAGVLAGTQLGRRDGGADTAHVIDAAASPLDAAAAVQRAGSDYVAAVTRLRDFDAADEVLRMQGYEAAVNVLSVTSREVAAALDLDEHQPFVDHARDAHAAVSQRVTTLLRRGGE